jgi:anti-anti-sigma regulatory factor
MSVTSENLVINNEGAAETLKQICGKLPANGGEVLLDFFFVQALPPAAIQALEELAGTAELMKVKVILRGVNVELYKVLKLSQLCDKFGFID